MRVKERLEGLARRRCAAPGADGRDRVALALAGGLLALGLKPSAGERHVRLAAPRRASRRPIDGPPYFGGERWSS